MSVKNSYIFALDGKVSIKSSIFHASQLRGTKVIFFNKKEINFNQNDFNGYKDLNFVYMNLLMVSPNGKGFLRNIYFLYFFFSAFIHIIAFYKIRGCKFLVPDKSKSLNLMKFFSYFFDL